MILRRLLQASPACLLLFASLPAAKPLPPQGDYAPPVIAAVYPTMIKMTKDAGNLEVTLRGKNFLPHAPGEIWNVREVLVYVRHAGTAEPWRGLYNNLRDNYPNFPLENGTCQYDHTEHFRLSLPKPLWCSSEGQLEFKVVKGEWDGKTGEFLLQEKAVSPVFKVAVRKTLDGAISWADKTYPAYYILHQADPPPLMVYGRYAPGSVVMVDNVPLSVASSDAAPGWITANLPAGFLDTPGQRKVTIRDPQNSPCVPTNIWVYGPPVVKAVSPKGLLVGGAQANLEFTYDGLLPDKAEVKVGYVYSVPAPGGLATTAQPANPAAIPPKAGNTAKRAGAIARVVKKTGASSQTTPAPAGDGAPKEWADIAFGTHGGKIQVTIPAAWLKQEGVVKVRLTGMAGSVEASIPIKKSVTLAPSKAPTKILR
jgi:hypothetical protein